MLFKVLYTYPYPNLDVDLANLVDLNFGRVTRKENRGKKGEWMGRENWAGVGGWTPGVGSPNTNTPLLPHCTHS